MEDRELILKALGEYSCVTARELSNYINRTYHKKISPTAITFALRFYYQEGAVDKSDCGIGTHYWVKD